MDKTVIIHAEGLGKKYVLGQNGGDGAYRTFREVLTDKFRSSLRRMPAGREAGTNGAEPAHEFWALRGVNFEVHRGEVVGVIGRNGAGKSTLLKILSRITEPTAGRIALRGRVASLLEVGTGFHPELTGRENIFLNGAILGMHRSEIKRKFDEIVDFAEVEKFLDTPVKRYSSGMYVRLAFAVAAHLEPEILIIDEVLAVGDMEFQKKCLGKMQQVAEGEGRTVLFVSHNMGAVGSLCKRVIALAGGRVVFDGNTNDGITKYLQGDRPPKSFYVRDAVDHKRSIHIREIELCGEDGQRRDTVHNGEAFIVRLRYHAPNPSEAGVSPSIGVTTTGGVRVFQHHSKLSKQQFYHVPEDGTFVCRIPKLPLPASVYRLSVALVSEDRVVDEVESAIEFSVLDGTFYPSGESTPASHGLTLVEGQWDLEKQ